MPVGIQAGEPAPIPAIQRAKSQPAGQQATSRATAGGNPERCFASQRRRQTKPTRASR